MTKLIVAASILFAFNFSRADDLNEFLGTVEQRCSQVDGSGRLAVSASCVVKDLCKALRSDPRANLDACAETGSYSESRRGSLLGPSSKVYLLKSRIYGDRYYTCEVIYPTVSDFDEISPRVALTASGCWKSGLF
jgi:hypothetical protein